jgi:hypothetical protein
MTPDRSNLSDVGRALIATLLAGLVLTAAASAKGTRAFDRHVARVGSTIQVGVGDLPVATSSPWTARAVVRVTLYLLPLQRASEWWSTYNGYGYSWGKPPKVRGAVKLGSLMVGRRGLPRLAIRVPEVPAGRYVLGYLAGGARWASARPDLRVDPFGLVHVRA